jgi:hypothetical protein
LFFWSKLTWWMLNYYLFYQADFHFFPILKSVFGLTWTSHCTVIPTNSSYLFCVWYISLIR